MLNFCFYLVTTDPVFIGISDNQFEVMESDGEVAIDISVLPGSGELRSDVVLRFITEDDTAIGTYASYINAVFNG